MTQYAVIEADPPWLYKTWSDAGNAILSRDHYDLMSSLDIKALPVADLAADNCALFLWATWPLLPVALAVGAAWGFEYKTCAFDWVKRSPVADGWHFGMGQAATRANSEPCLFFSRGNPKRLDAGISQIVSLDTPDALQNGQMALIQRVTRHSAKPEMVYSRIEHLFAGPFLRLFARDARPGWTSLGNELTGKDIRDDMRNLIAQEASV
jgi:N6-adenosine-specific RNA methylase IME4